MKTEVVKTKSYTHDFPSHYREVIERLEKELAAEIDLNAKGAEREYVLRGNLSRMERKNAALRSLAQAMADEMELHGGEMVFESLTKFRAKEGQP